VSFVIRRKPDGSVEVDGRSVRFKPLINFATAEKCVYAMEHWSKVVARGMRLDTKIAPKVTEAVENAGAKLVETAAGMLFQRFFGGGRGAQ
jgi:alpha-L-fucosidase